MALSTTDRKKIQKVSKAFEHDTEKAFSRLMARVEGRCRMFRLFDTHAAGAFLPEVAGDFIGGTLRGPTLVECKTSIKHETLRSCLASHMDYGQAAQLSLWTLAGFCSVVLFYSEPLGQVEIWPGGYVGDCRAAGTRLDPQHLLGLTPMSQFDDWIEQYFMKDLLPC